jgi:hypothetical protein
LCGKKARPLPEHCSTVATVSTPIVFSSATDSVRGVRTPSMPTCQPARSARIDASGGVTLLRT